MLSLARCSLVGDGQFVNNIKVFDHVTEFSKRDLAIKVFVGLHNGAVDKLLELSIVKVVSNHHLKDLKELTVGDEAIVVDIVDLEGKTQLFLRAGTCRERVETLDELKERDVAIIIAVKNSNNTPHKRVVS